MATVGLIGTLDTKGVEYAYVKKYLERLGVGVLLIDIGILNDPPVKADLTSKDVASYAGVNLDDIRFSTEDGDKRSFAVKKMSEGLALCLNDLIQKGKCDAFFGMGGSGGTNMLSSAFQSLPLGVPKLILSTMMSGDVRRYVGGMDIAMMYSVTDIAGLNHFSKLILANAANAAAGMAQYAAAAKQAARSEKKPLIAITMFGITTSGVLHIRDRLEESGFDTVVFHATGTGGTAMENMIRSGLIDGVVDYTLAELCDYRFGGVFPAEESRLTAAGDRGIPQIVVPGAIEVLNFGSADTVPGHLNVPERKLIIHNSTVCAVKANMDELKILGKMVGEKLSTAKGPTKVLLPLGGLDKYDSEGGPWRDPQADAALFDAIRSSIRPDIQVSEYMGNVNDAVFADQAVREFLALWSARSGNAIKTHLKTKKS